MFMDKVEHLCGASWPCAPVGKPSRFSRSPLPTPNVLIFQAIVATVDLPAEIIEVKVVGCHRYFALVPTALAGSTSNFERIDVLLQLVCLGSPGATQHKAFT